MGNIPYGMLKSFQKSLLGFTLAAFCLPSAQAEAVQTTLTKVADLPFTRVGESPESPRGGILQVGDDLWFTTYAGGENSIGAIVSYNLVSGTFTTQHSFGLPDPSDPTQARYDGFAPWKTTLTQGTDGRIYYATQYGGASWTNGNNGGAIGSFDPNTVASTGVKTVWSGAVATNQPRNLGYTSPIYVPSAGGGASVYFNTYAGGASDWGTVQKVTLDASGNPTGSTQIIQLVGGNSTPNTGRQTQGGLLLAGNKIYYTTASTAGGASATLQVLDTTTDQVSVLSTNWLAGSAGAWNTPLYDAERNSIYSVTLSGGILKFDLTDGLADPQSLLPNSADGSGGNFADPILFGDAIYYVKQASGSATGDNYGGQIWRYDLESENIQLLYNLKDTFGLASNQSGSLSVVIENGQEVLYFLTASDRTTGTTDQFGALYRLEVIAVPEPGVVGLVIVGLALCGARLRSRR